MGEFIDLTGKQSGTLVAIEYIGNSKWRCKCTRCGNIVEINTCWFNKNPRLNRDGCKHIKQISIGDVFGQLTVVERAEDYIKPKSGSHERQWRCKCICGKEKIVLESNLKANKSLSCGLCSNRISIPEKMIYFYLSQLFDDIQENFRPSFLDGKEIDIFLPSLCLGIEYDGERWHKILESDLEKNKKCLENGIHLIHIREPNCPKSNDFEYQIITPKPTANGSHMTLPIKQIIDILKTKFYVSCDIDVDCLRDNADICKAIFSSAGFNSLLIKNPEIAAEWDYEKNSPLTPDKVPAHSGKKVWWICPKGHSYSSVVSSRTGTDKCGCPICSNKGKNLYHNGKYIGEHSLAKIRPDIAIEFDEEKNGISSDDISVQSNKKMWFKCSKCGFEWQTKVNNRTSTNNQGCPICAKEKVRLSRCRAVLCVETGVIYESATEAGQKLGINRSRITICCQGHQSTYGGFHWKYLETKNN